MTDTTQQRCTLCDCERIPLDREKTRFGACTNIQCEDPTLDYRNEQSTLPELLEKARHHVMTDEEKEAQRQSWVRGEMALDRDGQTRVMREVGGAQPEPDEPATEWPISVDTNRCGHIIIDQNRGDSALGSRILLTPAQFDEIARARAGSSPAPSHEQLLTQAASNRGTPKDIDEWAKKLAEDSVATGESEYGVTGNEGKDMQNYGSRESQEGALKEESPLASPAVVTRVCVYGYQWCSGTNRHICEWCIKDLQAKVSELEAQLQHYNVLRKSDPYEYRVGSCCGDAHMLLESSLEHIKLLGFETETVEEEHCTVTTWHNRRAEKAEAGLEHMRAGGKS